MVLKTGTAGNNKLIGTSGVDTLNGLSGNDILIGLAGADILDGGTGIDTVDYTGSNALVKINLAVKKQVGGHAQGDSLISIENVTGSRFNDIISGNAAVNILKGGAGNDILIGLAGADILDGGTGIDTVDYTGSNALVKINLAVNKQVGGHAQGDSLFSMENVTGSRFNDIISGNAAVNILKGGAGNDIIKGLAGNDKLDGGAGNDVLNGGAGADTLIGGAGIDTASYENASVGVSAHIVLFPNPIVPQPSGEALGDTFSSIENLRGSNFDDTLIGSDVVNVLDGLGGNDILGAGLGNDTLLGGAGDDILDGGNGADVLNGGTGNNWAFYTFAPDDGLGGGVTASLSGPGSNTSDAAGDTYISIQNLSGSFFDDILTGDANNNVLHGGAGADTLNGLAGSDWASYEFFDGVNGNASGGLTASFLGDIPGLVTIDGDAFGDTYGNIVDGFIENLRGSQGSDILIGDTQNNIIEGLNGFDFLAGDAGSDDLRGGEGDDTLLGDASALNASSNADILNGGNGSDTATYQFAAATSGVVGLTVSLASPGANTGEALGDTYISIENIIGSAFNDTLTGDASDNVLEGGGGADAMNGGGNGIGGDWASYQNSQTGLVACLDATQEPGGPPISGDAVGDTFASIENLRGSNLLDSLFGDAQANIIEGLDGDDYLNGRAGTDELRGGQGDDVLEGGDGADALFGGDGINLASYRFAADAGSGVGVTVSLDGLLTATGHAIGDTFDLIQGLEGSDFNDTLRGDAFDNTLLGGFGSDVLQGGDGADRLKGGGGVDTLTGGAGADSFIYDTALEASDAIFDLVNNILTPDFVSGEDSFVISAVGFGGGLVEGVGLGASNFIIDGAATDAVGTFLYDSVQGEISWDSDGTGAGLPVFIASIGPNTTLLASDFVIIA